MLWSLLIAIASAQGLAIDANVPVEIHVEGHPVAQLFYPAHLEMAYPAGPLHLVLVLNGNAKPLDIEIPEEGQAHLLIGRNGITTSNTAPPSAIPAGPVNVQFRVPGQESLQIRIGNERHVVQPAAKLDLSLAAGHHPIEIRNGQGTTIWARGSLHIGLGDDVIVQLSDGRTPEVVGSGSRFVPETR